MSGTIPTPDRISTPDLGEVLNKRINQALLSINCHQVGTINSFNAATCTASIQIAMKRVVIVPNNNGVSEEKNINYPLITDCPVVMLTGGNAFISMPVQVGDECLVCFNDRDLDLFINGNYNVPPNSRRLHAFTDAIAIVGLHSANKPLHVDTQNIVIKGLLGGVIKVGGEILVESPMDINIKSTGGKIGIGNDTGDLKAAVGYLIDVLYNSMDTNGDSFDPATKSLLLLAKGKFDNILKAP